MGRLTKVNKEELTRLKSEISEYSEKLMSIETKIYVISPKEATRLSKILAKLKEYQKY
jgi:hypothetical protein